LRVLLNNVELYYGELAQGCGNQIFDYCQTIRLVEPWQLSDNSRVTCATASSDSCCDANSGQCLIRLFCVIFDILLDYLSCLCFLQV